MVDNSIPKWTVLGDWFDVCKCNIPCPCTFAQDPSYGDCAGILVWHIQKGQYSKTVLDGLNVLGIGSFTGNFSTGQVKDAVIGFFIEERANEQQREALQMIFSGKAGGFIAKFVKLVGKIREIEFAPIKFEIANDLSYWTAEIPGKIEALTGPMTPPGKRVQTINALGSETGPGNNCKVGKGHNR